MSRISGKMVKSIITKTSVPLGGYCANPYVGCLHGCKYCYASFMGRFSGHTEAWGDYLDVKYWEDIKNPKRYAGDRIVIGTVTDPYQPVEVKYGRTRDLLEQLKDSDAIITICTKSSLVVRDLDLLSTMKNTTVSFSINTLDEKFQQDMDLASSIKDRIVAMRSLYENGVRTVCFVSPIFPGITDVVSIIEEVKDICDFVWLENLNLRGDYKGRVLYYIRENYRELYPLYESIYYKDNNRYWGQLIEQIKKCAEENHFSWFDNYLPDGRSVPGKPAIVNYLYHEEVRGSENTGKRFGRV